MKYAVALVVVFTSGFAFGWRDWYHLAVGAALLLPVIAIVWYVHRRVQPEGDDPDLSEGREPPVLGRELLLGLLGGSVAVCLMAGGFRLADRTPLRGWFSDRDRDEVLATIRILDEGRAYERIVQIVGERQNRPISERLLKEVGEHRVRALLAWAENLTGDFRLDKLRQARQEAKSIGDRDLENLAHSRIRIEKINRVLSQTGGMRVWRIPDVLFETGKSAVTPGLREEIGEFSRVLLEQDPHAALRVEGHTDASGTREFNQRLSDERAAAVRNALMNAGIAPQRITAVGLAETRPVASNETVEGRARNRRVDIVIQ